MVCSGMQEMNKPWPISFKAQHSIGARFRHYPVVMLLWKPARALSTGELPPEIGRSIKRVFPSCKNNVFVWKAIFSLQRSVFHQKRYGLEKF